MSWYLVACKPKQEIRALENLLNQSVNAFLPLIEIESLVKGKVISRTEPLFPGYLFVNLELGDPIWSKIRSTRGVRDFVRFGGKPAFAPESIVENLRENGNGTDKTVISKLPREGDVVIIKEGPFHELQAVFKMTEGTERAIVFLNILGKNQQISINLGNILPL